MSFFEDASLVLIPSAQKTSKVYSVKPTDGTGDLTFTRSNDTATRVGPDGLIEKVRTNRFTYSQDLSNAAWKTTTDGGTITKTANAGTAPDGTNTATRVQVAGGGTYSLIYQDNVNPLGSVVVSGYFKRYGGTNQTFRLFGDNGSALSSTLTATDTWQRFSFVMTAASAGADGLAADASNNAYDILVWGMQLETGDIATAYIATTTAAVSVGPVANVPRLDYLNSSCPRLLLEPQRTNLALQSESVTASTTNVGYTATSNATTSPDGYASADQILEDTSTLHLVQKEFTVGSTTDTYAASFFVKANGRTSGKILYGLGDVPYSSVEATFNLTAGTITAALGANGATAGTSKIENYGNGWYRVSVTGVIGTAGPHYVRLQDANGGVAGDPTKGFFVWGFQAEAGAYATSYIPTLGAAVTRAIDQCEKTATFSNVKHNDCTLFYDFEHLGNLSTGQNQLLALFGVGKYLNLAQYDANTFYVDTDINGTYFFTTAVNTTLGRKKVAIKIDGTSWKIFFNGAQVFSTTLTEQSTAALSEINLGGRFGSVSAYHAINQVLALPAISDADCIALTA